MRPTKTDDGPDDKKKDFLTQPVIDIPVSHKLGNASFVQLVNRSGYLVCPEKLSNERLIAALRVQPDLVDEWMGWSRDKRVTSGWYFDEDGAGYVVGHYPDGPTYGFIERTHA